MKVLFHCTARKNLERILRDGLSPKKPDILFDDAIGGVYLSEKPFDWMHRATNETVIAGAMIEVDVTGLELIVDDNVFWADDYQLGDKESHPSFIYPKKIPPERFIKIYVSTDEKPSCFEEYKKEAD